MLSSVVRPPLSDKRRRETRPPYTRASMNAGLDPRVAKHLLVATSATDGARLAADGDKVLAVCAFGVFRATVSQMSR